MKWGTCWGCSIVPTRHRLCISWRSMVRCSSIAPTSRPWRLATTCDKTLCYTEIVETKKLCDVERGLMVRGVESEQEIVGLYNAIVENGLSDVVWYQAKPQLSDFFKWLEVGGNELVVMLSDDKVVGCGFLNDVKFQVDGKSRCEVGFVVFPGLSPFKSVRLGKMCFDLVIKELRYDFYYGTTPTLNPKAVKYAKLLGMRHIATIPNLISYNGVTDDAVISYLDKSSYPLS